MKHLRSLLTKTFRACTIAALAVAILAFGHLMTPRSSTAFARVFQDLGSALSSPGMPEYMRLQVDEDQVQEVYINDNLLSYTLHRTSKDIGTLLDYYENLYQSKKEVIAPEAAREHILATVKDPADRAEHRRRILETERILNERFIRYQGKSWGAFATIVTGKEGESGYWDDVKQRYQEFRKTGKASSLGDPKLLVAFEDPSEDEVQYFTIWPTQSFDLRNLRPRDQLDAPGYDVDDIERPRGSKRLITFSQTHGGVQYEVLMYRVNSDSFAPLEDHFRSSMLGDGWAISSTYEAARDQMDTPSHGLLFAKGKREAYVSLSRNGEAINCVVIVQQRDA